MNVLDASAVIALLDRERGSTEIVGFLDGALISTVNLAEVLQKADHRGMQSTAVGDLLESAGVGIVPFDYEMALRTADLWQSTRNRGLSLADRACLSLAETVSGIAVTTDMGWAGLEIEGASIHIVRR